LGRIAEIAVEPSSGEAVWTNRIDTILESECEDDDDRATLLAWLRDPKTWPAPQLTRRLRSIGITCSDRAVQEWRKAQKEGMGKTWE
jgi:hypothetical protein